MPLNFSCCSRIDIEAEKLKDVGITQIYASPFQVNSEGFQDVETFKGKVALLKETTNDIHQSWRDAVVAIDMFTIGHPEGCFEVPSRLRRQRDLAGRVRPGFVCFLDEQRQAELLEMYRIIGEEGFDRVLIDDDFRDALCFCDHHLSMFQSFSNITIDRKALAELLTNKHLSTADIEVKRSWLDFRKQGLFAFAREIEKTLHGINSKLRIGICISAKRLNDLSGRGLWEWVRLFDTPEAPVFVRLAGEHYDERTLGFSRSVGWHQYSRELLPDEVEMMAEITYTHTISFKSPADIRLEILTHLASGLNILLVWMEYFHYNNGWKMLAAEQDHFESVKEVSSRVNNSTGIAIYSPENYAEHIPFDEMSPGEPISNRMSRAEPIGAYQGLGLMGFAVKLVSRIHNSEKVTILASYLPYTLKTQIDSYLDAGGILVVDAIAARSLKTTDCQGLIKYKIGNQISELRMEKTIFNGQVVDELAGFPPTSVYRLEIDKDNRDPIESVSELYDVHGRRVGVGALLYPVRNGWIIVLAYDLSDVGYLFSSKSYREFITHIFEKIGYKPEVQLSKDLFVQPLLFTYPSKRIILINYNAYPSEVGCKGDWIETGTLIDALTGQEVDPQDIKIPPLDIKLLSFKS